jgi:hypothetical protein
VSGKGKGADISSLPLDDQFLILLHKKIMHKRGGARRRAKKYYTDQYKKSGVIPKPLLLAGEGIMEGRKCSGRVRVLTSKVKKRFKEMVKASADPDDPRFIFVTQKARKVKTYHKWLEEEFGEKISLPALHRYCRQANLKLYLRKPDFEDVQIVKTYFNPVKVFDLIQVDGCVFQYLKIKDETGKWKKPQVIEFFDTGSRYMFILDLYFSESSENAVDLFTRFLLSTAFPEKTIRFRPDRAKGFLNLKRPIHELNLTYSMMPDRFYLQPDFSGVCAPKHKVHLESSHRTLHNFEVRIIKKLQDRIVKTEPGFAFKGGKMEKITVTLLDLTLEQLRDSAMIEVYRREHNEQRHQFSEAGRTKSWIPKQKLEEFLSGAQTIEFDPEHLEGFMRYGFDKLRATVSKEGTITYNKQKYYVALGAEKFSNQHSTKVYVSDYNGKLLIFQYKDDGLFLGEALCQGPSEKPIFVEKNTTKPLKANEVEQIAAFLEDKGMTVNTAALVARYRKGLSLKTAKHLYHTNKTRYDQYTLRLQNLPEKVGIALFNAFLVDCQRYQRQDHVAPYASRRTIK